jgi:hypothetical protein
MKLRILSSLCLLLAVAGSAGAQAWTPRKSTGTTFVSYQYTDVADHMFSDGTTLDMGGIRGQSVDFSTDYGISNRLAATAGVALVFSRYEDGFSNGDFVENPQLDDGSYHGGIQDITLGLRYQAFRGPVVITPTISARIPSHNYTNFGHASRGNNYNEFDLGVNVGRPISWPVSGYAHVSYQYGIVEDVAEFSNDRSVTTLSLGYFLTSRLSVHGFGLNNYTHDGIDWGVDIVDEASWDAHDSAAQARYWRAGISFGYQWSRRVGFSLGFSDTLDGENTHDARSLTFSSTYNFISPFGR